MPREGTQSYFSKSITTEVIDQKWGELKTNLHHIEKTGGKMGRGRCWEVTSKGEDDLSRLMQWVEAQETHDWLSLHAPST